MTRRLRGPSARRPMAGVASAPVIRAAVSNHSAVLNETPSARAMRRDQRCTQAADDGHQRGHGHQGEQCGVLLSRSAVRPCSNPDSGCRGHVHLPPFDVIIR